MQTFVCGKKRPEIEKKDNQKKRMKKNPSLLSYISNNIIDHVITIKMMIFLK